MGRKKKKISRKRIKRKLQQLGKKGAEKRGKGAGSRSDILLPVSWESDTHDYGDRIAAKYVSPAKTVYHNAKKAKEALRERGAHASLSDDDSSTTSEDSESSEVIYSPEKKTKLDLERPEAERRLFVAESSQIFDLVDQVNRTSRCGTNGCNGKLVPAKIENVGLGGTMTVVFVCNGCQDRSISFDGSTYIEGSRRTVVSLALTVAFIISGHGFAKFNKTLNQFLGISAVSKNRYYEVVELMYPVIDEILSDMCDKEKENMKLKGKNELGSWEKAVVTSDGVWHTRGHFSKNGSFIIKNYMTGGLLWFGHKCMRGKEEDDEDGDGEESELYKGTSKSMEGVLAEECYQQAKDEGCNISAVWQDGDSTSKKSVNKANNDGVERVFKCGGHVGRAHEHNLKDLAKQKSFTDGQIALYKSKFDKLDELKCHCKRHSKDCGCLTEKFIKNARINHFCCLQQCSTPEEYARRMRALSTHHCVDEHQWKDGKCGFHHDKKCSCGECKGDELKCEGVPYSTSVTLSCPFHHMAYRIECELRAEDAKSVIHPEMGRGHSNLCEAHFSVLPHFRAKDQSLNRVHYITSTNCGLAQGNMTWCYNNYGAHYHWVKDLYRRLNIPVMPAMEEALLKATEERMQELQKKQTEEAKRKRISWKTARAEDQEERRKWGKRQALLHTYGNDDDDAVDVADGDGNDAAADMVVVSGRRKCKCGATDHQRASCARCPLNKKNKDSSVQET